MSVWFEGSNQIECSIEQVKQAVDNHGELYAEVIGLMPGMKWAELVEQGTDFVTIETNEGRMKRTDISKRIQAETVVIELDEKYMAGRTVTTMAHFLDEFKKSGNGVEHRVVISRVEAPGWLGFFYRAFGKSKTGNAFLKAYKVYFESLGR